MKRVATKLCTIAIAAGLAATAPAAELGTYVLGSTGLKGATMPPPGIYVIDLAFAYHSRDFRDSNGDKITQVQGQKFTGEAHALLNITGISWISEYKIFGANYGVRCADTGGELDDTLRIDSISARQKESGNADLYLEPLNLSWHLPRFDLFVSYGFYAPVGEFRRSSPVAVSDRWSHLFSAGMTAYLDDQRKWALSILPRYELYHPQIHEDFRAGDVALFEWGFSRTLLLTHECEKIPWGAIDVGPIGYGSYKLKRDTGTAVLNPLDPTARFSTQAAGVEASLTIPKWHAARLTLRFEQEFEVHARPQGQLGVFRFSVKF
jgi:hypothetical protein